MALAIMATVLALALVVLVDGVLSLSLDRDVITETDAGPLVAIAMAAALAAVVLVLTLRRRPIGRPARTITAALAAVVLAPLAGAVAYALTRGEPGVIPVFFGEYLLSPFVLAGGAIAAVVVLAHSFVPASGAQAS